MKDGFIKVAAVTPKIRVADTTYNGELIRELMEETVEKGAKVVAFPELCITGYTCGDLFWQDKLIKSAEEELLKIAEASEQLDGIFFVGLPFATEGKLYNVAAAISGGEVLGMIPKSCIPNYNEFYEARYFESGENVCKTIRLINGQEVELDSDLLFVWY